jgi:predicted alpha/beta-hydrolase family hydrolase
MTRVARGLAGRGITVVTFEFPYMEARRRVPDPGAVLEDAFANVWREVVARAGADDWRPAAFLAGGKSMGGRISSQAAARGLFNPAPAGLVFFGYPLHPPGKPAVRRDRHLPSVTAPMLFVQGTRDPFGTPDELTALTVRLPSSSLLLVENGDHSLAAPKREDPAGHRLEGALDAAAGWMLGQGRDLSD